MKKNKLWKSLSKDPKYRQSNNISWEKLNRVSLRVSMIALTHGALNMT